MVQDQPTPPKPEMTPGTRRTEVVPEGGSEFQPVKPSFAPTPATEPEEQLARRPEVVPPRKPSGEPEISPPRTTKIPDAKPEEEWKPAPSPQIEPSPGKELEPSSPSELPPDADPPMRGTF